MSHTNTLITGFERLMFTRENFHKFCLKLKKKTYSAVGIAARYGLHSPGIESRWGARFSSLVQTGPGAHPASCTMGTGSFLGLKRPRRGADHPSPSKCRGHERVRLYLYSPFGSQWPVIGRTFYLTFTCSFLPPPDFCLWGWTKS